MFEEAGHPISQLTAFPQTTASVSGPLNTFKFGTTQEELDLCFNNIGHIISVLFNYKLDNKFFDIFDKLKPINDIDEYMCEFNFDKDVALRHNSDLSSIVRLWISKSNSIKSRFESSLENVNKTQELLKLMDRQDRSHKYSTSHTSIDKVRSNETIPSEKVLATIKCNDMSNDYTLSEALNLIKETKEKYQKQHYSSECYKKCVQTLSAMNDRNKQKISRWNPSEDAMKRWKNRLEQKLHFRYIKTEEMNHQNDRPINTSDNNCITATVSDGNTRKNA